MKHTLWTYCAVWLACGAGVAFAAADANPLGKVPHLKASPADDVRAQIFAWLDERQADPAVRQAAEALWAAQSAAATPTSMPTSTLDALVATVALVDTRAQALVELCNQPSVRLPVAPQEWLTETSLPPLVKNNFRLYYGRWLSQQRLFDESLEQLAGLEPTDVVDPATLLFYQSVAHHRLLHKTDGLKAIDRLMSEVVEGPTRYVTVAGLMREDLKALKDDSLDHISRRMDDIRRRLDLGRAGEKVRSEEDGVISALDKLIEEMENQQQQQQQQQAGGGRSAPPSQPMPDSRIAGASGPGQTNKRDIGRSSGWGDLPAKDREEALQQIGKDFPSHYREIIEQYFRKLATEEEPKR